jgi:peptidoglycan/LPS O-acetylase OafA/YrhL
MPVSTSIEEIAALPAERTDLTRHRKPLNALTGIRLVAAYFIVLYHTRAGNFFDDHHLLVIGNILRNGYLAVPMFFLLSGFILAYTYEGHLAGSNSKRRFWEARFARIWPTYILSMVVSTVPFFSLPTTGAILASIFMVQAWNPAYPDIYGSFNLMAWSVSVEAFFYAVFPWCQLRMERLSKRQIIIFLLAMLAVCVLANCCGQKPFDPKYGFWRYVPFPIAHLPEFLSGVAIGNYLLRHFRDSNTSKQPHEFSSKHFLAVGKGLWTYSALILSIFLLCRPDGGRWTSLIMISYSALLLGLAAETTLLSRFLSTRVMLFGGAISYSIYLMQWPVKNWGIALAGPFHLNSDGSRMLFTAALLPCIAAIISLGVEGPARKFLRSTFARWELRGSTNRQNTFQGEVQSQ